jgi:hypothetical protein
MKYMWKPRVGPLGLRIHPNRPRGLYFLWRQRPYCIFDRLAIAAKTGERS